MKGWVAGKFYDTTKAARDGVAKEAASSLGVGMAVNSTAYEGKDDKGKVVRFFLNSFPSVWSQTNLKLFKKQVFIGSKTEVALLNFGKELGIEYKKVRDEVPIEQLYPFSSARKRMSVLVKSEGGFRLYSKGASEIIVSLSKDVFVGDKVV